ncbi:MAG TPA: DUF309 domain-containing protein [Methylomirabilota bacterium]
MLATLPRPLRDRLAETIVAALHDPRARDDLAALASGEAAVATWGGDAVAHGPSLRERARRASAALSGRRLDAGPLTRRDALDAAARLYEVGLFFEVHEVLEPLWREASGSDREALQGLIQVAVGYQHLANGNVAGARTLLAEGAVRLADRRLEGADLSPFAAAVRASAAALDAGAPADVDDGDRPAPAEAPPFPRELGVR